MLPPAIPARRAGGVSEAVDEAVIEAVVNDFYGRARLDPKLGPVFDAHISDWSAHLPKMVGFWATVLHGEKRYEGNPVVKHEQVEGLGGEHFARWLELFAETVAGHCSPADAEAWETVARRMGFAMSYKLGFGECEELLG